MYKERKILIETKHFRIAYQTIKVDKPKQLPLTYDKKGRLLDVKC